MSAILKKIDDGTWNYVPGPLRAVIRREAWLKLLIVYLLIIAVMAYRFFVLKRSVLFHSISPINAKFDKWDQMKESLLHVSVFLIPGFLAFGFNRPPRRAPDVRE